MSEIVASVVIVCRLDSFFVYTNNMAQRSINTRNIQNYEILAGTANGVYINPLGVLISGGFNNTNAFQILNETAETIMNVNTVIDLVTINGDLTVNGTATFVETKNLEVTNSMISLNNGAVAASDIRDIGFYGLYIPVATNLYTGLVRDATDGVYKFFTANPTQPNLTVNDIDSYLADVALNSLNVTNTLLFKTNLASILRDLGANGNWTFAQTGSGNTVFSNGGSNTFTLNTLAATFLLPVSVPTGSAAATTLNFGTAGTGLYSSSTSSIDFSTSAANVANITAYQGVNVLLNSSYIQLGSKLTGSGSSGPPQQGYSTAISSDGSTVIVGGYIDNGIVGAAWVFVRSGNSWTQQGSKLVGSSATGSSAQGRSVALSADGNTAVVGGSDDNTNIGAIWIFIRTSGVWTPQGGKIVGTGVGSTARQGWSVSISADGNTAAAGGYLDSASTGATWIFTRSNGTWTQEAKLVGTGATGNARQGYSVSLSSDGNTLAVGGDSDNSGAGATWIFTRSGTTWTQQGTKLVGTIVVGTANQGTSVSLSSDGNTLAVGGISDNTNVGATWIFTRTGSSWTQQGAKLVASDYTGTSRQGNSVSLSGDGNIVSIGAYSDNSGIGATWTFTRSGTTWSQQTTKLVGTGAVGAANQGRSVSLSKNGAVLAIGGNDDNGTTGATWIFGNNPGNVFAGGYFSSTYLGSSALPVFNNTIDNETSGIFWPAANNVGISTSGTLRLAISTTTITSTLPIINQSGTVSAPAYSFLTDTTTGLFYTASKLNFSIASTNRMILTPSYLDHNSTGSGGFRICDASNVQRFIFGKDADGASADVLIYCYDAGGIFQTAFRFDPGACAILCDKTLTSAANPTYSWVTDTNTGMYSSAADTLNFTTGGTSRMSISTTFITNTLPLVMTSEAIRFETSGNGDSGFQFRTLATGALRWLIDLNDQADGLTNSPLYINYYADAGTIISSYRFTREGQFQLPALGSAAKPAVTFLLDPDTGIYSAGDGNINFSTNSTLRMSVVTTEITTTIPFRAAAGSAGAPSYSFVTANTCGMYSSATNAIDFSTASTRCGGFTATTGQFELPLSYNPATPSNTPGIQSGNYNPSYATVSGLSNVTGQNALWYKVGRILHMSGILSITYSLGVGNSYVLSFSLPAGFTTAVENFTGVCTIYSSTNALAGGATGTQPFIYRQTSTEVRIGGVNNYISATVTNIGFSVDMLLT